MMEDFLDWVTSTVQGSASVELIEAFFERMLTVTQEALAALPSIPFGETEVPSLALIAAALVWLRAQTTGYSPWIAAMSAALSAIALWAVSTLGFWEELTITLAMTVVAAAFALVVGVLIGRALGPYSRRDSSALIHPFDFLAKIPEFTYFVPVVLVFSIGNVPSIIMAALIALFATVRRVRQVSQSGIGSLQALSATLNAAVMRAYAVIILASMIGAGGLGRALFSAINRIDMELGVQAAAATVLLAFVLDRLTDHSAARRFLNAGQ